MDPSSHELQRFQNGSTVSSQRLKVHDGETHTSVHDKGAGYELQPEPSFYSRLVESSWTLEVLAWILAAAALVILIVVLAVANGKSLSHWHSTVSVNTLVNVLTTIASVALIFPVASGIAQMRWIWLAKGQSPVADIESFGSGPIDVFVMLWKHPTMLRAYFAALNVVLIILFSPITQATVDLQDRQRNLGPDTGSVAMTTAYTIANPPGQRTFTTLEDTNQAQRKGAYYYSVAYPMQAAINSAITEAPVDPSDVKGDCSSGNCTFPVYETMGICSRVDNVTSTIKKECHHQDTGPSTTCSYSVADLQKNPTWRQDNMTEAGNSCLWVGASDMSKSGAHYPDLNSLGIFYTIYTPDSKAFTWLGPQDNFADYLVALKGTLNLCLISYQTTIKNGITRTMETSRATDLSWKSLQKDIGDNPSSAISTMSGGKEYWMSQDSVTAFLKYLSLEIFHGNSQVVTGGDLGSTNIARILATHLVNQTGGQDHMSQILENVATSMTNALRSTSDKTETAPGVAAKPEIYIAVEFRWLIIPIASVILTLLFLLAIIFESARRGIPAWKLSQIKPLLHLDQSVAEALCLPDEIILSEARAKEVNVKLEQGADRQWRLYA